ncbi:MAG: TerB family tellurite resistance protein, partial [Gammaproteobacteria bacterium]|nr:TerB family tellurite resistance protein [Gammaproteobacteria bacterium]
MHIVIGILTSILTILYILERLGIDIGWLNPWSWHRRRAWAKRYHGDPIYSIEDPIDVAAVLIVGTAKLEGDLSAEQKAAILS